MSAASKKTQLWMAAGVVEAPIEQVAALALDAPPGPKVAVDHARRTVATWGDWWYRGETTLEPHPRGTRLVYRVYNIAQTQRWMVPLVYLQTRGALARGFEETLSRLGRQLGCAAYRER